MKTYSSIVMAILISIFLIIAFCNKENKIDKTALICFIIFTPVWIYILMK